MSEPVSPHVEVAAYVLGKLEADEAAAFETHLAGCADCQRQAELRGLPELLATATPAIPVPDALRDRTLVAVRQAAARAEPGPAAEASVPTAEAGARRPRSQPQWPRRQPAGPGGGGAGWWSSPRRALVAALAIPGALLLEGGGGEVTR